jgi:lysophospholipase L1-like esterase
MKKIIFRLINTIIVIFIFCFTLELLARCDDKIKYNAPMFEKYSAERLRAYDSNEIRYNIPNAQFEKWKINTSGFRGNDFDNKDHHKKIKIVCMGASETFGLYESLNNEWPAQLSDMLGKSYTVVNTAVVGQFLNKWKPYLDKYVLDYKPDMVILHVNPFNYAGSASANDKRKNRSAVKHKNNSSVRTINMKTKLIVFVKQLFDSSRILPKIKQVVKNILPESLLKRYQLISMKKQVSAMENSILKGETPLDTISIKDVALFQRDLNDLIKHLKAKNIKIVLSTYPMLLSLENMGKYSDIFYDFRRFYIRLSLKGLIDASIKFNDSIIKVADENAIDVIDLYGKLSHSKNEFGDNVHYTDDGAKKIAFAFAELLLTN